MGFESFLYDQVHRRYTLYDQNVKKQIGLGEAHPRPAEGSQAARVDEPPAIQFVTDGRGNVPLGNTTDNSAIRTQQGFQAIKERFKLLDSARKYLMENVLNTVSIIV